MRALSRLRRRLRAASFVFVLALVTVAVGACAAPSPNGVAPAGNDAAAPAATSPASPAHKPMHTGGRLPADPVEAPAVAPGAVDLACKTDADCTVKNVGNCCGYYPACVNVNSPTDPKGVQAECAKKGMMSVCGFPEISSCSCRQGKCEAASSGLVQ
ncbi:hypothetical protein GCM10027431_18710 [Lysobacter rhizosphaerae]